MSRAFTCVNSRVLSEAFLLCLLAAVIGLSINYQTIYAAFSGQRLSAAAEMPRPGSGVADVTEATALAEPFPVMLDEVDELLAEGALLIDSRNKADYVSGHLAGAVSVPLGQAEELLFELKQRAAFDRTLIVYCSGYGCPDSHALGVLLLKEGFTDVLVYEGGYPEWRDAGRPLAGGAP